MDVINGDGDESNLIEDEAEPEHAEDSELVGQGVGKLHPLQPTPAPTRHCHCCMRILRLLPAYRSLRQWWGTREVVALCKLAVPIVSHVFRMRVHQVFFVCVHNVMCVLWHSAGRHAVLPAVAFPSVPLVCGTHHWRVAGAGRSRYHCLPHLPGGSLKL